MADYIVEEELKNKGISREAYAAVLASKIAEDSNSVNRILAKTEMSDDDKIELENINKNIEYIYSSKILPKVAATATTLLGTTKETLEGVKDIFTFTPTTRDSATKDPLIEPSDKNKINTPAEPAVILADVSDLNLKATVSTSYVQGAQKYTQGIANDLRDKLIQPTLEITREDDDYPGVSSESLHDPIEIKDSYIVSFKFKINKFPSKIYQDNTNYELNQAADREIRNKRFTSRRSDIITYEFNGDVDNKIEFAAIAPFGINSDELFKLRQQKNDKLKNLNFEDKFYPFAIAASFPNHTSGQKFSVYTDYKFNLNTWYTVSFKIQKANSSTDYCKGLESALSAAKYTVKTKIVDENNINKTRYEITEGFAYETYNNLLRDIDKGVKDVIKTNLWNAVLRTKFIYEGESFTISRALNYLEYARETNNKAVLFGGSMMYNFSLSVNGIPENIAEYNGKLWGSYFNKNRKLTKDGTSNGRKIRKNRIASMPGFKTVNFHTIPNRKTITRRFKRFNLSSLKTIYTAPYQTIPNISSVHDISNVNTYLNASPLNVYKKRYNRQLHKLNHGIDFGEIKVSAILQETKKAEINKLDGDI
jgi:hypothetical protein